MQEISDEELKKKLEERGYWSRIQSGKLLSKVRANTPATITPEGTSQIISFWDEHLNYLCTIHRVITKGGEVIHEDVKDAYLDGIRYRAISK